MVADAAHADGLGYVQGLADAAAFLLKRMPPPAAFGCLQHLSSCPMVRLLLRLDVDEWILLAAVFGSCLSVHAPAACETLSRLELDPPLYLPEWLMPLWTRSLSPDCASHVWNMMVRDDDSTLILAAVAVCAALEAKIVECTDMPSCRAVLSAAPRELSLAQLTDAMARCALSEAELAPLRRGVRAGLCDTR